MTESREDFAEQLGRYLERAGFTQQELANKIGMHRNTIVKWLNRASWPTSRGQVLRVADELFLSKQERKALLQAARFSVEQWPTEVWTVPQQRDMFFTGRDEVFRSLREHLVPGRTMALTQAISGLGGIGKTHTAVEYAYRFHRDYEAVLWLQADSWETLVSACVQLADELALPEQKEADQVVAEVQRWLRKHRCWLLILDNVEFPQEILSTFVPTHHHGSVLMTTRVHDVEPLAQTQVLSTMSEDEGVLFLLRRTKKVVTKAGLDQAGAAQQEEARQTWQLMDGLPLALDQAGAYILETGCSFSAYHEQYARRRAELLDRRGKRFIGHEASVATTFSLAFERVEALNPAAADLLRVCSLLASEAIPEEIFREGVQHLGPLLATGGASWDLAIGVLHDYSLVQRNAEAQTLIVHRLVQAVLKEAMDATTSQLWAMRTVNAVNAAFPPVEHHLWLECDRLLPHALLGAELMERYQFTFPEATRLLNQAGFYLQERARYQEAGRLLERAFSIREQQLGPEHPNTIHSLNNLALLYNKQGKHAEAESLYERALAIRERQLGPEHADTAGSLNNLALLYKRSGKYEQAESLYERALAICERQLGPEHLQVAYPLNNLALLYSEQGKYMEAEPLLERALSIWKQQLGPEHPDTAQSLNNLAYLYKRLGKYDQAETLYLRALSIYEQRLGSEHLFTVACLNNLASLYRTQERYAEAEPLWVQVLALDIKKYGESHPEIVTDLNILAGLYYDQGKYEQAEPLLEQALSICEQQLWSEHPDVVQSLNNLAGLYESQEKYELARPLYERALAICEQWLGPEHSSTALSLNNLAYLYESQGKYAEAEPLYERALSIYEQRLGPEHPDTARSLNNLAELYKEQGKYEQVEPLHLLALSIREQQLGPEHPDTVASLNNLVDFYYTQGKYEQALSIRERQLGSDHPDIAAILNNLAGHYRVQGKYMEAKLLYERALSICEQQLGSAHPDTLIVQENYASLLQQAERDREVASPETNQEWP